MRQKLAPAQGPEAWGVRRKRLGPQITSMVKLTNPARSCKVLGISSPPLVSASSYANWGIPVSVGLSLHLPVKGANGLRMHSAKVVRANTGAINNNGNFSAQHILSSC